jgi:hypothetical protein
MLCGLITESTVHLFTLLLCSNVLTLAVLVELFDSVTITIGKIVRTSFEISLH